MALFSVLAFSFSFFIICNCKAVDPKPKFPYQVAYFDQYIDHFNELSNQEKTFKQKYLYSGKHWKSGEGPIFFYTGNEGPIEAFWENSGFVHELAAESEALVIFSEHRYYGSSLPYGKDSFKAPNLGQLTVEQAMADYAVFLTEFVKKNNASSCKVIAFGGSYGGMLAAYMRFKYPNIVYGSLAASAPIYMQDPSASRDFFFKLVTKDFVDYDKFCVNIAKRIFSILEMFAKEGERGLDSISRYFRLCTPLKTQDDYRRFKGWLRNAFVMMSMLDYPYPTSFMGNLPAYPVKAACNALTKARNPIYGMGDFVGVFYNATKDLKCFDLNKEFMECADPTGCGIGNNAIAWDYQACTEIWLPGGTDGETDMFLPMPWTDHMRAEYCLKTYGVMPRLDWPSIQFWGEDIKSTSNIIFSNGDLDPWRGGGVTKDVSDTVVAITVVGGAHHLDLRGSNHDDPKGVVDAREKERAIIRKWIGKK